MIKTDNINTLIEYIQNPKKYNNKFIESSGLAKHKDQFYKIIDSINGNDNFVLTSKEIELKDVLKKYDKDVLDSLQNALLTSYFTPDSIIDSVVNPIKEYYTKQKFVPKILEPSSGTGNFIKSLHNKFDTSNITSIEKDIFTANILSHNFKNNPNIAVVNTPFEDYDINNKFDLIISNIPFGNHGVFDKQLSNKLYPLYKNQIHNYFFLKAEQLLNKGGMIAFITTSSFSDRRHSLPIREHLVNNLNLISAIRLDNKTFKDSNTTVVADLIIFQKPVTPKKELSKIESLFVQNENITLGENEYSINKYFKEFPSHVLGEFTETTQHFGNLGISVEKTILDNTITIQKLLNKDLLQNTINSSLSDLIDPNSDNDESPVVETKEAAEDFSNDLLLKYPNITPGNFIKINNVLNKTFVHPVHNNLIAAAPVTYKQEIKNMLNDMIGIRDAYKNLLNAQRDKNLDLFKKEQSTLNSNYDLFNFYYGPLNLTRNIKYLKLDSDYDLLLGLERNHPTIQNEFIKAEIFEKISFEKDTTIKIDDVNSAIIYSYNTFGKIDIKNISELLKREPINWVAEAISKDLIFFNPNFNDQRKVTNVSLELKSKFLSGYVNSKINFFRKPNLDLFKDFQPLVNKQLLEGYVLNLLDKKPLDLSIEEINPNIGEPWIDDKIYSQFLREHFKIDNCRVNYFPSINSYKIVSAHSSFAYDTYSVNIPGSRMVNFKKIVEFALYQNIPDYKKTITRNGKDIKISDQKLITAVQLKIDKLNENFTSWLSKNKELSNSLAHLYNYRFNSFVKEDFNGSQFDFGLKNITPYGHQKNGAWQFIQNNGGILDHKVGFGKTITMAMSIAKRIELKITSTELLVGLNANYEALYDAFVELYPSKKAILVRPIDLKPENKNKTFYNIANNKYDLIVTAHSCLIKFPEAPEVSKDLYNELLFEAETSLKDDELTTRQIREIDKKIENIKAKLSYYDSVIKSKKIQNFITFEDLNINHITIDESQYFKNLSFTTSHSRVAGLGNQNEVQKTSNLLSYIRSIQSQYKADKGVTFSTGTTISNSITELYNLFRYLTPNELKKQQINTFDQWARFYCRKSQTYEESISGEIKLKERFRHYVKVPELAQSYNRITNYADDTVFKLEKPEVVTKLITIEPYKEQKEYFDKIKEFGKTKNPRHLIGVEDSRNVRKASGLICTNQGKKAALDMRLISSHFEDHPESKINVMIDQAIKVYNDFDNDKGTQLIFCDQGTPTGNGFNLYQSIKDNLIKKGINENEITFIHSHSNKNKLFKRVNNGEIRFLIGSTQKLGVGVNVQQKLVAMHHLDFPWRPTDMEQRNGRGDRQGNLLLPKHDNKMQVFYYAKKESTDAYIFNLLQIKFQFILQIKNASISTRTLDEGIIADDGSMSFEHFMAACSSNQNFTEKLKIEKKLQGLLNIEQAYISNQRATTVKKNMISDSYENRKERIDKFSSDFNLIKTNLESKSFNIKLDKLSFKKPLEVASFLKQKLNSALINNKFILCNVYDDFKVIIQLKNKELPLDIDNYKILVETPNGFKIGFKNNILVKDDKQAGMYIYNSLNRIPEIIKQQQSLLSDEKKQLLNLDNILNEPFKFKDEIEKHRTDIHHLNALIKKENNKDTKKNNSKSM